MNEQKYCVLPYCLIPLSSDEPLWEWDLVSDALFLSQGACKSLNLPDPPMTMQDFYRLMPADTADELKTIRKSLLNGRTGSVLECAYICNGLWVQESMLVLTRNSAGQATRVMGRIASQNVDPANRGTGFSAGIRGLGETGTWILDVKKGLLWHDRICTALLGLGEHPENPLNAHDSLKRVHPAERSSLQRHYRLFTKSPFLGDAITDLVRMRQADGEYVPMLVRGNALERDAQGRAVLVSGVMAQAEPSAPRLYNDALDDSLYKALNTLGSGQWNWDTKIDAVYFCPRYLAMLGYPPEDAVSFSRSWRSHIHPDDYDKVMKAQKQIIDSRDHGDTFECTYRMRRADGDWAWIFDRGCVTWRDANGRAGHMIGSITNITTAQAERDKLEELVRHDALTGLRSRAYCYLEIEHIEQNSIRPVSVISVDITGLKMINDNLGHAVGDEMLTKAAFLLQHSLRQSDCIGRVGGDEFIVLLPNCNLEKGRKLLRKIENSFTEYNSVPGRMPVYVACGLASAEEAETRMPELIARADDAMYGQKKAQRKEAHRVIKEWIKKRTGKDVCGDDRLSD